MTAALLLALAGALLWVFVYALFSMSARQAEDEPIELFGIGAGELRCFETEENAK